jgi:hypothetical protein
MICKCHLLVGPHPRKLNRFLETHRGANSHKYKYIGVNHGWLKKAEIYHSKGLKPSCSGQTIALNEEKHCARARIDFNQSFFTRKIGTGF